MLGNGSHLSFVVPSRLRRRLEAGRLAMEDGLSLLRKEVARIQNFEFRMKNSQLFILNFALVCGQSAIILTFSEGGLLCVKNWLF